MIKCLVFPLGGNLVVIVPRAAVVEDGDPRHRASIYFHRTGIIEGKEGRIGDPKVLDNPLFVVDVINIAKVLMVLAMVDVT
jgi:hypothetical protein